MNGIWVYLIVNDAKAAIDYYRNAFSAEVGEAVLGQDSGRVMNVQLKCFGTTLMLMDEFPEYSEYGKGPKTIGHTTFTGHIQLDTTAEVDHWFNLSVANGAVVTMPVQLTFWGDYYGQVRDPFGHDWSFGATPTKH
jgi:PhnB protein